MFGPVVLSGGVVAAAEVTTIFTESVADGCMMSISAICAVDPDSAIATYIEIGVKQGSRLMPIASKAGSFAANVSHSIDYPVVLLPGQQIYAKFATPTAGDKLAVYAYGVVECMNRSCGPSHG